MKIFLIVIGSIIGFFALVVGILFFLWFYQGGCCVKKLKNKFSPKIKVDDALKENE